VHRRRDLVLERRRSGGDALNSQPVARPEMERSLRWHAVAIERVQVHDDWDVLQASHGDVSPKRLKPGNVCKVLRTACRPLVLHKVP
jgi:hypothetical protein